jgi:hypothetical protein
MTIRCSFARKVALAFCTAHISIGTASLANVPYQGSTSDVQSIAVVCSEQEVNIAFVRRSDRIASGLQSVRIGGESLASAEIARANALLQGQKLSAVTFMGCRKTRQGDLRHWISLEPSISAKNANQVSRSKWFYIRHGKVEVHERQPID